MSQEVRQSYKTQERTAKEGVEKNSEYMTARVTPDLIKRLDEVASETQRTLSQVIRLLVEHGYSAYKAGYIKL